MKKNLPLSVKSIVLAIMLLCTIQFGITQQSYFGDNILPNPGFEDSFTGNWQWDETVLISTGEGSISQVTGDTTEGSKKLLINVTAPGFDVNNAAALNVFDGNLLNGFAGRWYMALDAKSSNDTTPLKVGLRAYDSYGINNTNASAIVIRNNYVDERSNITQNYVRYDGYTFTRSSYLGGDAEVRVMVGEQIGTVSADNMELRAVLDIVNGGFEEDSLLFGWELEGKNAVASIEDRNINSGNSSLKLVVDSATAISNQYFHNVESGSLNDTVTFQIMGEPGDTVIFMVQPWTQYGSPSWKVYNYIYSEVELERFVLPPEADTSYIEYSVIIPHDFLDYLPGTIFHQYKLKFNCEGTYYLDDINFSSAYTEPTIRFALQDTTIEVGNEFSHFIQYTGDGNISLSFSTDASWLNFNNDTISGIPQMADTGTYFVKVIASNGNSSENDTTSCILTVVYNDPEITTILTDTTVEVGNYYTQTIDYIGTDASISITQGADWLTVENNTVSGIPSITDTGTYAIETIVSNGITDNDSATYYITVDYTSPVVITSLPDTVISAFEEYTQVIDHIGTSATISIIEGADWLNVAGNTLNGTPSLADTGTFTIKAIASNGITDNDTSSYEIFVDHVYPLIITSLPDTIIQVRQMYKQRIEGAGDGSISLSVHTEASCISVINDTITATPLLADTGIYSIKVVASNGNMNDNDTVIYNLTINYIAPEIAPTDDDSVLVNTNYSKNISITGEGVISITPDWLLINPEGEITGTPDTVGEFLVRVSVNDQIGPIVYEEYNLTVYEETSNISSNSINKVKIYPNPASDVIHILNAQDAFVSVYNISGINVLNQTLNDAHLINTQHLEPGLYIISVKTNSGTTTQTLRIQ